MDREICPAAIAPTPANYAHAVLSDEVGAILHTSAVVPIAADGSVPESIAEQARVVWGVIGALLTESGMTSQDIVSISTYVVVGQLDQIPLVMAERDAALAGRRVASTLVTVPALARPEWLMEVSVVAVQSR